MTVDAARQKVEKVTRFRDIYCLQILPNLVTFCVKKALADYRKKLMEHKEIEARLKKFREDVKGVTSFCTNSTRS